MNPSKGGCNHAREKRRIYIDDHDTDYGTEDMVKPNKASNEKPHLHQYEKKKKIILVENTIMHGGT